MDGLHGATPTSFAGMTRTGSNGRGPRQPDLSPCEGTRVDSRNPTAVARRQSSSPAPPVRPRRSAGTKLPHRPGCIEVVRRPATSHAGERNDKTPESTGVFVFAGVPGLEPRTTESVRVRGYYAMRQEIRVVMRMLRAPVYRQAVLVGDDFERLGIGPKPTSEPVACRDVKRPGSDGDSRYLIPTS